MADNPLAAIAQKINRLIEKADALKADNERLQAENGRLRSLIAKQNEQIEDLEHKNLSLQLTRSIVQGTGDTSALRQQIGVFIEEIDKCIAALQAQADLKA